MDSDLKTPGISGIQLLDLHDFPGQGTALVGLLNAFWGSKGIVTAEEFREFCSPVVPLLRFAKATYTDDETFDADIELSDFSDQDLNGHTLTWTVKDGTKTIAQGTIQPIQVNKGHNDGLGKISLPLTTIAAAIATDSTPQR